MKADYHMHSTISDGRLTPREVVMRAAKNRVECLALTDHDDLSSWSEAWATANECGIRLITGVEISTTWHGKTIHILGYGFRALDATLKSRLDQMRSTRAMRSVRIAEKLSALGFPYALEGAQAIAGRIEPISRTHFARWMINQGYCRNFAQAMNQYLADGQPASVDHDWVSVPTAVQWIREAGGHAFIAHPLRYKMPQPSLTLAQLIDEFTDSGGVGMEVVYNQLGPNETAHIADIAWHRGLVASRGSDFHSDGEGADIGAIADLPKKLMSIEKLLELS